VQAIERLEEKFEPQFPVELSKAGEYGQKTYFGKPFGSRKSVSTGVAGRRTARGYRIIYVIQCHYCGKRFRRSSHDTRLNAHKDKFGNACHGLMGYLVEQTYG
jgi:hypothetical protein